jgi:hypothetical protein
MSLPSLFSAFSQFLHSPQFCDLARQADAGNAFVRRRKLPLPALVAVMLSGMRKSVQTGLDEFFAHLKEQAQLVHHVSEQAFAKARAKLSTTAIPALNDWLVARADADGFVPRWHGRRLVAADASTLRFGRRASHVARAASAGERWGGGPIERWERMPDTINSCAMKVREIKIPHTTSDWTAAAVCK